MPWEFALLAEGYWEAQKDRQRIEARWMSYLLTVQTGSPVTVEQLLGEKPAIDAEEQKASEGARRIAEIERLRKRAAKKKGK